MNQIDNQLGLGATNGWSNAVGEDRAACYTGCRRKYPLSGSKAGACMADCRRSPSQTKVEKVMESSMGQQLGQQGLDADIVEQGKGASGLKGLSTGAWVGIGVGVAAIGVIAYLAMRKK